MARSLLIPWALLCALLPNVVLAQLPADAPRSEPFAPAPLLPASGGFADRYSRGYWERPPNTRWHPVLRVALETVGGTAGELGGIFLAGFGGIPFDASVFCALASGDDDCEKAPARRGYLALLLGISLGETLGVYGAGTLAGGEGQLLPTIGGTAVGTGAALLLYSASKKSDFIPGYVSASALPTLGTILGYELSSAFLGPRVEYESSLRSNPGLRLVPVMGRSPEGGLVGGLAGQF